MEASGLDNLNSKVDRIVVLMMENRSFDHMLGYLSIDHPDWGVDGLDPSKHGAELPNGDWQPVWPLKDKALDYKIQDPGHEEDDIRDQLERGFILNYADTMERHREKEEGKFPADFDFAEEVKKVVGYQDAERVPVYDWIARNYQVCDRWFCSVPGATWENRMTAMTGDRAERVKGVAKLPGFLKEAPIYDRPAFTRYLDDDDWRWYSFDPATLRLADSSYRPGGEGGSGRDENFAYFNRETLFERKTFLDDAKSDDLPKVCWIDPNSVDFRLFGPPGSNDDHPPSRVMLGQELVLTVLRAITREGWEKTMLLVVYDEAGGFYDHVDPRPHHSEGDPDRHYGVRVPALVVSPYAAHGVCRTVFDHTAILKTILTRFAGDRTDEALAQMGPRTQTASDLGGLLTLGEDERREPSMAELDELMGRVAAWKQKAYEGQLLERPTIGERAFEAGSHLQEDQPPQALTDWQQQVVASSMELRAQGVEPGRP